MLKNYFKKKSKFSIAIDVLIGLMLILLLIPATRKDMAALILKPTLIIHQPRVMKDKQPLQPATLQWQLQHTNGTRVTFGELEGRVVFINLWATWCPPCIAEMPQLQKLYNDYSDKVVFLFVSNEEYSTIKAFMEKKEFTLPAYMPLTQYPDDFEATSIPTTFIINKKGEMVVNKSGVAQWNSKRIRKVLDVLIAQE